MILLTWILAALLVVAVVCIAFDKAVAWLQRRGSLTIRFVVEDDSEG